MTDAHAIAGVPMRWVGPVRISGNVTTTETQVPLATYESPLWPSVGRGAKVSMLAERGIVATLVDERMTRSVLVEATDAQTALMAARNIEAREEELRELVRGCSRFARLIGVRHEINANLLFVRFEFATGDASGHNMATLASDVLLKHLLETVPGISYGSISGNYCTDKKATAINGILGRGKNVVTELLVPREVVSEVLHTTAARIVELNIRKTSSAPCSPAASVRPTPTSRTCCSVSTWPRARTRPTSSRARRASPWPRTGTATSTSPAHCPT